MLHLIEPETIIEPDIYSYTSLENDIEQLSNPHLPVTDEAVINLIVKFFYAYKYSESVSEKVDLLEIEELFSMVHYYFGVQRKAGGKRVILTDPDLRKELSFIQESGYPLSMLGDIASTTVLVRSIMETVMDSQSFEGGVYTGLDLGSGTGILMLAQYIQAMRNGFSRANITGLDISKGGVIFSDTLVKKLGVGKVIEGDTTQAKTYDGIVGDIPFSFVSNETISTNGVSMSGVNDPFHQNNQIIFGELSDNVIEVTQFFPTRIDMLLQISPERDATNFHGEASNKFALDVLIPFEERCKELMKLPDDWSIFDYIYPVSIDVGEERIRLNQVGENLYKNGKVKRLSDWRVRWYNNEKSV